jgi:prolyl oligopeptidase
MRDARFALVAVGLLIGSLAWSTADNKPAVAKKPAAAPVKPIVETLFGRKITDNYRYMEALDPATIEWMKSQGAYTRSLLDSIKPLAHLKTEVAKFSASFGLIQGYVHFGTQGFYEERAPGSDNFDLMVTDSAGIRKLVDVAALRAANGGKPFAINYFLASPDGNKVAVGISEGGSEDASITVYDVASGAKIGGPVDRAQFGATSTLGILNPNRWRFWAPHWAMARRSRRSRRPRSPLASAHRWRQRCRSTACKMNSPCGWRLPRA